MLETAKQRCFPSLTASPPPSQRDIPQPGSGRPVMRSGRTDLFQDEIYRSTFSNCFFCIFVWVIWPCTLGELQWYMVYFVVVQQYVHPPSHDDVQKLSIHSHINKCHRHAQWPGSLHTPLECWPCTRHVPAETMQKRCLYGDMEILWLCVCGRYLNPSQLAVIFGNNMKPCFQQYQQYFQQ